MEYVYIRHAAPVQMCRVFIKRAHQCWLLDISCGACPQVFVTCGTADKRAFLLEAFPTLREDHIGDSRSCTFEEVVKRQTNGAGVHLALNSLADDKLQVGAFASMLSCLTWLSHDQLGLWRSGSADTMVLCLYVQATVRCLGECGRLLEIGKHDILKGTPLCMRPMMSNIAFEGIDLERITNNPYNVHEVGSLTCVFLTAAFQSGPGGTTRVAHTVDH